MHLAAWHCGHRPPVSDPTIHDVNVNGTFHVLEAARSAGVRALIYGSSMAIGHGSVYGLSKVIGEALARGFHERTNAPTVVLRYHAFTPRPYLDFGLRLLANGVDRADVAAATLAAVRAALAGEVGLFTTIVHTDHRLPPDVAADFAGRGADHYRDRVPAGMAALARRGITLPRAVERHDLSAAAETLGWRPAVTFETFLHDLARREAAGLPIDTLVVPGGLLPA